MGLFNRQPKKTVAKRALRKPAPGGLPVAALFGFGLLSAVANILMLTGPIFMLQVYDRVIPSRSVPTLVALIILTCALYGFYGLVEWMRSRIANRFGSVVDQTLSPKLLGSLIRRQGRNDPDPLRDLDTLRSFLSGPGPSALCDLPWMPFYLGLIYLLHPLLGLVTLGGAAIITILLAGNEIFSHRPARAVTEAQNERKNLGDDIRAGAEVIRAMSMERALAGPWDRASSRLADAVTRAADQAGFYLSSTRAFRFLLQSATLATGAWLVLEGQSSGGMIIGASILSSRAIAPVEQVVGQWRQFVAARQAWKRLRRLLSAPFQMPRKVKLPAPVQRMSVNNLTTGPARDVRPCLTGVAFELTAGDGLGVVGLSGSGKSSLARALVGAWPHLQGEVRLDGQLLAHYGADILGPSVGYLPQEIGLFEGTVGENIARFQEEATSADIIAAARSAGIHDLIATLPNGYDTNVGERGIALSAGQRQRIGLARALFGKPFLLVLDEPNSNLDAEGDAALTQALMAARARGAIVVVIAHRPSAIAAVDKLLFLQAGCQAAFGEKDEVLRQVTGMQRPGPRLVEVSNVHETTR